MDLMNSLNEVDWNSGVNAVCYKCGGKIKTRKNLVRSLTKNAWGHKKCNRFSWSYRSKHLDDKELNKRYCEHTREELGIA